MVLSEGSYMLGGAGDQLGSANVNIKNSQSQHRRQQVVAAVGDHDYYYKFWNYVYL